MLWLPFLYGQVSHQPNNVITQPITNLLLTPPPSYPQRPSLNQPQSLSTALPMTKTTFSTKKKKKTPTKRNFAATKYIWLLRKSKRTDIGSPSDLHCRFIYLHSNQTTKISIKWKGIHHPKKKSYRSTPLFFDQLQFHIFLLSSLR